MHSLIMMKKCEKMGIPVGDRTVADRTKKHIDLKIKICQENGKQDIINWNGLHIKIRIEITNSTS